MLSTQTDLFIFFSSCYICAAEEWGRPEECRAMDERQHCVAALTQPGGRYPNRDKSNAPRCPVARGRSTHFKGLGSRTFAEARAAPFNRCPAATTRRAAEYFSSSTVGARTQIAFHQVARSRVHNLLKCTFPRSLLPLFFSSETAGRILPAVESGEWPTFHTVGSAHPLGSSLPSQLTTPGS